MTSSLLSHARNRPHVPVLVSDPVVVAVLLRSLDYSVILAIETSDYQSGVSLAVFYFVCYEQWTGHFAYHSMKRVIEIQSVIQQPTQPSVIQSTALQTVQISKGNVILLKQPSQPANSVIQSASGGGLQTVQVLEAGEDQESSRKRQILARRPSYRKILNELGGGEISDKGDAGSSDSSQDEPTATVTIGGQQYQTAGLLKVLPASGLQLAGQGSDGLQTLAMTNAATAGGAIVHYAQGSDPQFIVPVAAGDLSGLKIATSSSQGVVLATTASTGVHGSSDQMAEEASRKREIRLMKNREAARECRAKKKEYIKCLENRVAVLENQNKALIEELKTLKALYCQNS
ncbi:cyclic AMP-dependent transcription factor ATF-1-like isoform X5 [Portunus trituberculatus]|uniref:cyclic AMP-dependent transcription factor ATF-1-like isoform X5 n=1 Tax=Portunus trituberculatus TaxID=210409 RepID=UPI001E1CFAF3|nr:cyclic AMP-dependent transcription factor ATF-1-like isoform X5 [Portunus trituberculatus]